MKVVSRSEAMMSSLVIVPRTVSSPDFASAVRLLGKVAVPDVDWAIGNWVAAEANHGEPAPLGRRSCVNGTSCR